MIFKFVQKKLVVDCFTYDELIIQTAPILLSTKLMPDWWKKLPISVMNPDGFSSDPTMKNCVGMTDYYRYSIAIPLWSALKIKIDGKRYLWQFADYQTNAHIHDIQAQATGLFPNHGHLKILSPWHLKTKDNVNWIWSQPTYSFDESVADIKILPGVVNFYFQHSSHINMIFPLNQTKTYDINQGQVLAHITPMTDKKIEIKRHLISKQKFDLMANQRISFIDSYRKIIKQKQKFLDCPYHKEK